MTKPAAITGDFSTYRHVQGRKVLQLIIEVPAEAAAQVFATLGMPGSGEGVPVALARLMPPVKQPQRIEALRGRVPFGNLPYPQQAAMRCNEPGFQQFLEVDTAENAAAYVRANCAVQSRSEIHESNQAGERWRALDAEYYAWQRGMR